MSESEIPPQSNDAPASSENRRGFLFAAGTTLMAIGGVLVAAPIIGAADL